jgi:hypothetical protein
MANSSTVLSSPWQQGSDWEYRTRKPKFSPLYLPGIPLFPNGLSRGTIAEITGRRSSGRTACLLHVLAAATQRGEVCAVVDTHNQFDPVSAEAAAVSLSRLVWIRCSGNVEHAIRATDLLMHASVFGVVHLDLCETQAKHLNKIPLSYWFRFRRAIESTSTILLVTSESLQSKSCSATVLTTILKASHWSGAPGFRLLRELRLAASLRKPVFLAPQSLTLAG